MIADGKELIALISEIRSQYNCFDNADQKYYEALSLVLRILGHLPSEQPCDDAISRRQAVDALIEQMPSPFTADGSHPADEEIFRVQETYADCIETIKLLPAVQPQEIIRCKDCKHRDPEDKKCDCGHDILWQLPRDDDWFCADAERGEASDDRNSH